MTGIQFSEERGRALAGFIANALVVLAGACLLVLATSVYGFGPQRAAVAGFFIGAVMVDFMAQAAADLVRVANPRGGSPE